MPAPAIELLDLLLPAYSPCAGFSARCAGVAKWAPESGHLPRGYLGATARLDDVDLILLVAEPGAIEAFDDSDTACETLTLALDVGATAHFNSNDLELGNAAKGLAGSTGSGVGDWRLALSSEMDIDVLAYIRTSDGFLTSMHDVVPYGRSPPG